MVDLAGEARFPVSVPPAVFRAPIAQLDRASDYGSEGWGFKSSWARHIHQWRKGRAAPSIRRLVAILATLALGACDRPETEAPAEVDPDPFALPPAALTERAHRDSARVAQVLLACFHFARAGDYDKAFACYFPDSIPVGTPDGQVIWEGQSGRAWAEIRAEAKEAPVARIEVLRRAEIELLEKTEREIWHLRFVRADADSTRETRLIHTINGLGDDKRFLGRVRPEAEPKEAGQR